MAWFSGKVSLGNFPDLAGAVNKLSESVKNIEKNFDTALGLEEKDASSSSNEASGLWPLPTDRKALFEPIMGFMGQKNEESTVEVNKPDSAQPISPMKDKEMEKDDSADHLGERAFPKEEAKEEMKEAEMESQSVDRQDSSGGQDDSQAKEHSEAEVVTTSTPGEVYEDEAVQTDITKPENSIEEERNEETDPIPESLVPESAGPVAQLQPGADSSGGQVEAIESMPTVNDANCASESKDEQRVEDGDIKEVLEAQILDTLANSHHTTGDAEDEFVEHLAISQLQDLESPEAAVSSLVTVQNDQVAESIDINHPLVNDVHVKEQRLSTESNSSDSADSLKELEKVKKEMKMMETALLGAARQAQAKADEIATLMNENEQLKAVIDDLRRKTNEAEIESLREEYHQRVAALERKVYALTKERDTLRREQNKKSDAAALLKEKDEIISQVMAEGEELSKKQAAQEGQIRKLRAQVRELEEEKKGLLTKLQVEENRAESIRKDKAATEKLLQETVEKHQVELSSQKEYYTTALNQAKEAEALAEARANSEARTELEVRLREAEDRESMLVQTLEELRQTLSRKEQQAVFREDMLRRDIEDLQKRYQESERRCEELIIQVPDSTRPLLRQIEAMKETASRQAQVWAAVEESFNSRLQEAEAKAAAAEEKERSINERLTQTLSRINVLEAQISCLRAEQTQLARSLEKERQRAAENRQEYLALKEEGDTKEVRVNQLEEEIRELKRKYKEELHEAVAHQELLQKELEREKTARLEQERAAHLQSPAIPDPNPIMRHNSAPFENGLARKLLSASSLRSMEESYFLQTTLDSSDNFSERRSVGEGSMSPYHLKSMTSNTLEAALRQKEGELASYMSRLASMESIRDSLAEELVKMTAQCEKLRSEAAALPGLRAEFEALRRRHSAALELMGERDEELEELRADILDMKDMYREQVNLLVNKIQNMSSSIGASA